MSKELTPLEALNFIGDLEAFTGECEEERTSMINELPEYKIIENALKALETIKEKTKYFVEFDDSTKTIYIDSSLDCDNEEYNLLKEVLL